MTAAEFTAARKSLGLTQEQFGERLGLHRVTVTRLETGARECTKTIALLVDAVLQGYEPKKQFTPEPP
jgi:transcriptional regulator with XRE-family HTH domain